MAYERREGWGVREGRDGVREDGVRYGKEAKVVQRGAGYVQRKAHTPTTTKELMKHGK